MTANARPLRSAFAALAALATATCSSGDAGPSLLLHVPSPAWEDQVVYFVMTDRFANGDKKNDDQGKGEYDPKNYDKYSGGDLQGLIDKLDYIQALGATAVWITPPVANMWWDPLQNSGGYHGYWARNLKKVDEHLGTLDTYKALSHALHKRGMYLIQDVVPNHMGNFFQYSSYDPADVAKGLVKNTGAVPTSKPEQAPFDQDDATDPAQRAAAVYHWTPAIDDYLDPNQELNYQVSDLDDLNTENEVVRKALRDSYGYWVKEVGVDAFRVDTAKYVPHAFWNDFFWSTDAATPGINQVARATGREKFLSFGEVFEVADPLDDAADKKVASYTGTAAAPEMTASLAYPLYSDIGRVFASGSPTGYLGYRLGKLMDASLYPNPWVIPTFVDNHDVQRFLASGTGEGLVQALAFTLTIPGIPVLYYGTEQAFTETRGAMFAGGYQSKGQVVAEDQFNTQIGIFRRLKALVALRKATPALRTGTLEVLGDNPVGPGVLAYKRTLAGETVLVMMNTAEERVLVSALDTKLPAGTVLETLYSELDAPLPEVGAGGLVQAVLPKRSILVARATSKVVAPAPPPVAITVATPIEGQTFTKDVAFSGTVLPSSGSLRLVLDGYVEQGIDAPVAADGSFSVVLPVSTFPDGVQQHSVVFYAAGVATAPKRFTTNVVFAGAKVDIDDPVGDDKGPAGTYTYPKNATFRHQMDLTHVRAEVGPTTLRLKLTMADFSTVWKPPNGFDHVAFNIYFQVAGRTGLTVMPKLQASVPAGFNWSYSQFTFGWNPPALYTTAGADADTYGAPAKGPTVSVTPSSKTITFTYNRGDLGLSTWEGVKIYVTTWDYDGIGGNFRPIVPGGAEYSMGGGQPTDPMIMDDVPPFALPAP